MYTYHVCEGIHLALPESVHFQMIEIVYLLVCQSVHLGVTERVL